MLSCTVLLLFLAVAMHFFALPKLTFITAHPIPLGVTEKIELMPDRQAHIDSHYRYRFNIDYQALQQPHFRLYPSRCITSITVAGQSVDFDKKASCNRLGGIAVDLSDKLAPGTNILEIDTTKAPVYFGPRIFAGNFDNLAPWLGFAMTAVIGGILTLFLRRHTGEIGSGIILSAALCLYIYQFSITGVDEYAMDIFGHMDYIKIISMQLRIPKTWECWSCFHAPIYYVLQAAIVRFFNLLMSFDIIAMMRVLSMGFFLMFSVFGVLTIRRFITHPIAYYSALLLFAFYPSGVFTASRVDSNMMFHPMFMGCVYFTLRWLEDARIKHLALAILMLGLAMAVRGNALILLPILGLAGLYQLWRGKLPIKRLLKATVIWACLFVAILGAGSNFGRTLYARYIEERRESMLVSNVEGIPIRFFGLKTNPETMLTLNFRSFLESTFSPPLRRGQGGDYFWNVMLKTSLFGEYIWADVANARTLNFMLIVLLLYWGNSIMLCWQDLKTRWQWWALMVGIFVPIAGLMALRMTFPIFPSQDFRYIYPVICTFAASIGMLTEQHFEDRRAWLAWLGVFLCAFFTYKSVMFFT